jgi:2-aminoethylphosphonate-pyruvate transaminase
MVAYVMLPDGVKFNPVHNKLKQKGFVIYPGKGPLTEKAMHIANIGTIDKEAITAFLRELEGTISNQLSG